MERGCTIYVAKTKALISCTDTAHLICVFVFAYANCWFSHDAAQMVDGYLQAQAMRLYNCVLNTTEHEIHPAHKY